MPVQIDYPTGVGTRDDWGLWGSAASKLDAVRTNDGDTSVIYADSGGALRVQRFTFPLLAGVADPINTATLSVWIREYAFGAGGRGFSFVWNSVQDTTDYGPTVHANQPNWISLSWSPTAKALSAVNGEHGFVMFAAGGPTQKWEVWVTQFYRTIDFTHLALTSEDHFAHIIGSLLAAIGGNLLLREMPRLARAAARKTGVWIKPSEYEEALRAWRKERHVRVFC